MSDSTITRKELTESFRSLIVRMPLSKISVGDICQVSNMNRKSFYYHFKDKYDIANCCFDSDFPQLTTPLGPNKDRIIYELCKYLYINRLQYRHLFETNGQNSFYDHLRIRLLNYFSNYSITCSSFKADFWANAVASAFKQWILSKKPESYDQFYKNLVSCINCNIQLS